MTRLLARGPEWKWSGAVAVAVVYAFSLLAPACTETVGGRVLAGWEALDITTLRLPCEVVADFLWGRDIATVLDNVKELYRRFGLQLLLSPMGLLANLLLWAGWLALVAGFRRVAWAAGLTALAQGLTLRWCCRDDFDFLAGFYLWLASMGLLTAIAFWLWWPREPRRPSEAE